MSFLLFRSRCRLSFSDIDIVAVFPVYMMFFLLFPSRSCYCCSGCNSFSDHIAVICFWCCSEHYVVPAVPLCRLYCSDINIVDVVPTYTMPFLLFPSRCCYSCSGHDVDHHHRHHHHHHHHHYHPFSNFERTFFRGRRILLLFRSIIRIISNNMKWKAAVAITTTKIRNDK